MIKITLLFTVLFLFACKFPGSNPGPSPTPNPTASPTASPGKVCDPVTQASPNYGPKNGVCLPSCGLLKGQQSDKACSESGLESAGPAYDSAFCCKAANPTPAPTPAKCPCLNKWGINPHIIMDSSYQMVDKPVQGGFVVFDTTPRFGEGHGGPCNTEHDNCSGRHCEDPRGPDFKVDSPSKYKIEDNVYQLKLGPLDKGSHTITACPKGDVQDETGAKVNVCGGGNGCGSVTINVP